MNRTIKNILIASVLLSGAGFVSCVETDMVPSSGEVAGKLPEFNPDAVNGELLVKFTPSVAAALESAGRTKAGVGPVSRSGIMSVDEILELVDGYEIERVFPVDPRTEHKAKKVGFDLWYVVRFGEEHPVQEVAANLARLGEVSSVQYNTTLKRAENRKVVPLTNTMIEEMTAPRTVGFNDPLASLQWDMVNDGHQFEDKLMPGQELPEKAKFVAGADVGVKDAWKLSKGHPSVIVAVVDEGVDPFHEDLKASMWVNEKEVYRSRTDNDGNGYAGDVYGYNFVSNSGVISTDGLYDTGHGTHVAGVIGAKNDNGKGICSIAGGDREDNGIRIMTCQIFSGNKLGTVLDEVRAIKYAADNGAVILQCSWGYVAGTANGFDWQPQFGSDDEWKKFSPLEYNALDYFINNAGSPDGVIDGGIAVFAGGNESAPSAGYPGAYPKFVSVSATAADFTPAVYTNYGPGITISAPGGDFDYYYEYGDGNSLNTGAVGAILSTLPKTVTGEIGEMTGYGYMEGTSMACPHVSGVLALGLSYAAELHKHFKAQDMIKLLYDSAYDFSDALTGDKTYFKYVAELQSSHKVTYSLDPFQGKMGYGQVNAHAFLNSIAEQGNGMEMVFPNVALRPGTEKKYIPSYYCDFGEFMVSVENPSVATVESDGHSIVVKGIVEGQTKAVIKGSGKEQSFVITVRGNDGNGWL